MFAVPGWSVSASSLKTQIDPLQKQNVPQPGNPNGENVISAPSASKKRKHRGGRRNGEAVTSDNLDDLWKKHVEKTIPSNKGENPSIDAASQDVSNEHGRKRRKKEKERKNDEMKQIVQAPSELEGDHINQAIKNEDTTTHPTEERLSKAERKALKKKQKQKQEQKSIRQPSTEAPPDTNTLFNKPEVPPESVPPTPITTTTLTPLQEKMHQKLIGARFRHLNETLYTTPSTNSLYLFSKNPEMFTQYHEGFRKQVEVWPENPVDRFIQDIQTRGKIRSKGQEESKDAYAHALPRDRKGFCRIVDLGCGDAKLAWTLHSREKKLGIQIRSFDLQAPNHYVQTADIANLPLPVSSVDLTIFCLALMGTNWIDFIEEAYRILRWKGECWIAEIKSRFGRVEKSKGQHVVSHSVGARRKTPAKRHNPDDNGSDNENPETEETLATEIDGAPPTPKDSTDVTTFVEVMRRRGFLLKADSFSPSIDLSNKMFVRMVFVKAAPAIKGKCVVEKQSQQEGGVTWKKKSAKRFLEELDEDKEIDEAKVLKPCVYKLR
ncbi:MAG: 25S rRNA (adenine645-N1)-methyltransferase [Cirrosporium novae-zelandiae]|nr:MAG: 25S rRNA (adenine645-N1)-methyltransferase [Cirrosporium novae-zelandiae]